MGFGESLGLSSINPIAVATSIGEIGAGLYEGHRNRGQQRDINNANAALQREFAKMGITWRVEDAKRAGIHPLAAIGAVGASASPSFQLGEKDEALSRGLSNMGQNISRSMRATQNPQERLETAYRLENMRLNNEMLKAQIDQVSRPDNPPLPTGGTDNFIGGQGDSGVMLVVPSKRVSHAPGRPAQEAGARPDVSYSRTDDVLVPVIPEGLAESMEDDTVGKILWRIRNQIAPNVTGRGAPPKSQLPPGYHYWRWDKFKQGWSPARRSWRPFGREVYEKFRYGR